MNRVRFFLTRIHIRLIGGRFTGAVCLELADGRRQEVLLFRGRRALFSGQCTFYNTLIINESVLPVQPLKDYVLAHEIQHKQQWWRYFLLPLALVGAGGIMLVWDAVEQLIFSPTWGEAAALLPQGGLALLCLLVPGLFSWLIEINADFQAIRSVGLDTYRQLTGSGQSADRNPNHSRNGGRRRGRRCGSFWRRALIRYTHPPAGLVVWLWSRRHPAD